MTKFRRVHALTGRERERERERERTQKITNSSKYGQDNHDQSEVHDGGAKYRIVRGKDGL